jgi:hypothetical protein
MNRHMDGIEIVAEEFASRAEDGVFIFEWTLECIEDITREVVFESDVRTE